ncbi:unnamed protein product [Owenia fusiformis]|uniref:Uncharacterized protein n=1 Tax=Owenia fusiformis TaxID=6347 RepID=A0A8J1U3Q2_OWEFU|nr:unnamed protein product [Owenia fusiformis]
MANEEPLQFDRVMDPQLAKNEFPTFKDDNRSLMRKHLTKALWDKLKDHKTKTAGWTLAQAINTGVVNSDSLVGCHAGDSESYTDFKELFDPVIEEYHGGYGPERKHVTDLDPAKLKGDIEKKSNIKSTRIRCARNLFGFPLNPGSTKEQRLQIEELMKKVCAGLTGDLAGTYYSIASMTEEQHKQLVADHFLFRPGDRFQAASAYHNYWPAGRGIFHNKEKTFLLWFNEGDHIRIISMQQGGDVKAVFDRLCRGVKAIEAGILKNTGNKQAFLCDDHLGMLTCCPSNLGTGLRGGVHIILPTLFKTKGLKELDTLVRSLGCQVRGTHGEHTEIVDTCDISNFHRIGRAEYELVQNMIDTVNLLNKMEDEEAAKLKESWSIRRVALTLAAPLSLVLIAAIARKINKLW